MPSSDQERMDALSEAVAAMVRRQREIDARLARIEQSLGLTRFEAAVPLAPTPPPASVAPPPPSSLEAAPEPAAPSEAAAQPRSPFETRMGLTLLNRAGVVTLVIGVLFFFKYAVDNKWIGETGRVMLGVLGGFIALAWADRLWRKGQRTFAQGISGFGIAVLYVSFYASFGFYRIVAQPVAFLLMALNTAAAGALALRYGAPAIAALGLAGGYLTPVLLSTGENRPWVLFSYLLLLDLGAVWLARRRNWRPLEVLAAVATYLLYFSWLESGAFPVNKPAATVFALVFYALFASLEQRWLFAAAQFLTPLALLIAHGPDAIPILPLLLLTLFAGLAIADRRGWPEAPALAFASFWIAYAIRHLDLQAQNRPGEVAFAFVTVAFLAVLAWIPWRVLARSATARGVDLVILGLNGAFYFGASYSLLESGHRGWLGLFAAAVAGLHFAVGRRLWHTPGRDNRTVLFYTGITLCFLTLAIPIQFAGYRITMAWALEAAALSWIAARLPDRRLAVASLAVFALVFIRLLAVDSSLYPDPRAYIAVVNARFLTFATVAVALWLSAKWNAVDHAALGLYVAGHFCLLWGLILEVTGWAVRNAAAGDVVSVQSTAASILLAAYAVVMVAIGVRTRTVINRVLGLGLIALVVLKLYFYDVWQIGRMYRVAAFAGLGGFLLLTSFLYSRFRGSIENWWRDEESPR